MIAALAIVGPLLGGIGGFAALGAGAIPFVGPLLKFFGTGAGRIVGVALLVASAYGYGWFKGDAHGDAQCVTKIAAVNRSWQEKVDEAAAEFAFQRKARDAEVDATLDRIVSERIVGLEGANAELQTKVKDYEAEYAKRPKAADSCLLGPGDIGLRRPRR